MNVNKEVLNYCPNYFNIVNFDFNDGDLVSEKLVNIYKNYVFSINLEDKKEIDKVKELDHVLSKYIEDYIFRSEMQKEIVTVRIKKDNNILRNIVDAILKIFTDYEEYTTRKLYISKWI